MKLGLIGAGRIGKLHAENITYYIPGVDIKTVADVYKDQAKEWAENLGIVNLISDYKDILSDPEKIVIHHLEDLRKEKWKFYFCLLVFYSFQLL